MGLLVALFLLINIRRLFKLGAVLFVLLVISNVTQTDNRRHVAGTWLRAIPGSYSPVFVPGYYSRFVEDPQDLTLAQMDTIVRWHRPDTIVFLYDDEVRHLPIIDSLGATIRGRPVLVLDAASRYVAGSGYETTSRRVADVLSTSRSLIVGTPLQTAGPVAYFMRENGYSGLRINLTVDWVGAQLTEGESAEVMEAFR